MVQRLFLLSRVRLWLRYNFLHMILVLRLMQYCSALYLFVYHNASRRLVYQCELGVEPRDEKHFQIQYSRCSNLICMLLAMQFGQPTFVLLIFSELFRRIGWKFVALHIIKYSIFDRLLVSSPKYLILEFYWYYYHCLSDRVVHFRLSVAMNLI